MQVHFHFITTIKQPIEVEIICRSKVRKWAYDNAHTLLFMAFICVITLLSLIVYGVLHAGE